MYRPQWDYGASQITAKVYSAPVQRKKKKRVKYAKEIKEAMQPLVEMPIAEGADVIRDDWEHEVIVYFIDEL